jgi:hypothetical protein
MGNAKVSSSLFPLGLDHANYLTSFDLANGPKRRLPFQQPTQAVCHARKKDALLRHNETHGEGGKLL